MAKATITIRIDRDVYAVLVEQSVNMRDTPNRVLRRLLGLSDG